MPLLPLGRSCPQKTILLSDLVRCNSPLQIVGEPFKKIKAIQTASYGQQQAAMRDPASSNIKKCVQVPFLCICSRLSYPAGWAALPSENMTQDFSR